MKKIILAISALLVATSLLLVSSCDRNTNDLSISEPITILAPDTNISYVKSGQILPFKVKFVTDRPFNYVKCMYEIDSTGKRAVADYTYPDTLFYTVLDTDATKYSNKYIADTVYHVPALIKSNSVIRFRVSFKASLNPSSTESVMRQKDFKMVVR